MIESSNLTKDRITSYLMEGTVVYTLSAKTGIIRAYKDGRIIYSDQKLEVMHRENPIMVSAIA